jgi:predicted metalloprotease with PDZ domain
MAVPIVQTVPDAQDKPYPGGAMLLDVDASDTQRGAFRVTQTIPVSPGTTKLILQHPRWLPGGHAPRGPLHALAGLSFTAGGKPVAWRRDSVEVNAFHLTLPSGAREVVAKFIYTSPLQPSEGRIVMTPEMLNLQWEAVSLYPAGHYVRRIRVKPTVTMPQGWATFTALDGQSNSGNRFSWAETDYETLVDSPIFAGLHARTWDLGNAVRLDAVADKPEQLALPPERLAPLRALVSEALLAFGGRHFDRYTLLTALTERMGDIGLEHHRSSENALKPQNFTDWTGYDWDRNVLAHELAHSWSGKFRRPAKLWTPDYRQPMQDDLLWVYEGQAQFWGWILAARSGLQTRENVLGYMAVQAGNYASLPGRGWRSVSDTTHDPIVAARRALPYGSLSRSEDYYSEGALIWLEADQTIRAGTAGRKGLDDFARAFYGIGNGDWVYPYDWASFLRSRSEQPGQPAPLAGIEQGGYRLVWKDEPNPFEKARMENAKTLNLTHSLGFTVDKDGNVGAPRWDGPAFNAGVVTGAKIVAVNGVAYDQDVIKQAVTAAKGGSRPIELLIRRGDRFLTVPVPYHGGLRWPWLERAPDGKGAAGLDLLLAPRRPAGAK